MNLCSIICIGYFIICLLFSVFIPCFRHKWKDFYNELLIDSFKDVKGKSFFPQAGMISVIIILSLVLSCLIFFLMPFCTYWLNRSYQDEKKRKKAEEEFWSAPIPEPEPPVNKEYKYLPSTIKLRADIPFLPNKRQVIYIESQHNESLNNYILKEYVKIEATLRKQGYHFKYIPLLITKIAKYGNHVVKYAYPILNDADILANEDSSTQQVFENILSFIDEPVNLSGGLMRYRETMDNYHVFKYYQFQKFEENEIWEQFRAYLSMVGDAQPLYSLEKSEKDETADFDFPYAAQNLIDEIKDRIEQLRQTGIGEMVIKSLFQFDDTVKLSRLVITNDNRIFLPDYSNMEIMMSSLPKTVYFLFLKHPEGILFKNLVDYREELMKIYLHISNRENITDLYRSVKDITDPTKNAINEKCSRIREAFIKQFDESIAQNYFITGFRLEPKKIILDRKLVTWETVI